LPAYIYDDGSQEWYKNGKRHRDDLDENGRVLPAIVRSSGRKEWWKNGKKLKDPAKCQII